MSGNIIEEYIEAKPYLVYARCTHCMEGIMKYVPNIQYWQLPEKYAHRCTTCGDVEELDYVYPRVEFKEIEQPCDYKPNLKILVELSGALPIREIPKPTSLEAQRTT